MSLRKIIQTVSVLMIVLFISDCRVLIAQKDKIPVKDKLFNLEKRLPFSVSQVVRNEETPDYKAEFKFYFTPVFDY